MIYPFSPILLERHRAPGDGDRIHAVAPHHLLVFCQAKPTTDGATLGGAREVDPGSTRESLSPASQLHSVTPCYATQT